MKMTRKFLVAAAVMAVMGAPVAFAEDAATAPSGDGPKKGGYFKEADTDGDGAISKEEYLKMGEIRFARMDKNGDGKLVKEEFPRWRHRGEGKDMPPPVEGDKPPMGDPPHDAEDGAPE